MDDNPIMSEIMSDTAGSVRPDRRRQRTRAAIVHSFSRLMFERRYDSFGVADIAERANVGRSTFYQHFAGKDVLLREAMRPMLDVLADAGAGGAVPDQLHAVIDHFWQNRRMGRIIFNPPMRALVERQLAEMIEARLVPADQLASLQVAAAQLCALDAWTSGAVSVGIDAMIRSIVATAQLRQSPQ